MKHTSRLFGDITYLPSDVYTFPAGLLGYEDKRKYILVERPETAPVVWLISLDEDGPEVPLLDPRLVEPDTDVYDIPLTAHMRNRLGFSEGEDLKEYCIVTLPESVRRMSINMRTPVIINEASHRGVEYSSSGCEKKPVRRLVYRDLVASRPQDRPGMLMMHRKINQTVEIGDDITIQVLELADGGVRLAITAPKNTRVTRGSGLVTGKQETIRASETADPERLAGIMELHRVSTGSSEEIAGAHELAEPATGQAAG